MSKFEIAEMLKGERTEGFIKKIYEYKFEIVDFYYDQEYSHIRTNDIDITKFNKEEKLNAISYFDFESLEEVGLEFGDDYESVIAQCLFMTKEQFDLSKQLDMETDELVEYIKNEYDIEIDVTEFATNED